MVRKIKGKNGAHSEYERLAGIWAEFKRTGNRNLRNQLIEAYYPIAAGVASDIAKGLPRSVSFEDLRTAGTFGLIEAVERYDPARGWQFRTFAIQRIRGAILDMLRDEDWVPRLVREQSRLYEKTLASLKQELGRDPSMHEIAKRLKLSDEATEKIRKEAHIVTIHQVAYETEAEDASGSRRLHGLDVLVDSRSGDPMKQLEASDLVIRLARSLTRQETMVIQMYYEDDLSTREIGVLLDVSQSRVFQIHKQAIRKLRETKERLATMRRL